MSKKWNVEDESCDKVLTAVVTHLARSSQQAFWSSCLLSSLTLSTLKGTRWKSKNEPTPPRIVVSRFCQMRLILVATVTGQSCPWVKTSCHRVSFAKRDLAPCTKTKNPTKSNLIIVCAMSKKPSHWATGLTSLRGPTRQRRRRRWSSMGRISKWTVPDVCQVAALGTWSRALRSLRTRSARLGPSAEAGHPTRTRRLVEHRSGWFSPPRVGESAPLSQLRKFTTTSLSHTSLSCTSLFVSVAPEVWWWFSVLLSPSILDAVSLCAYALHRLASVSPSWITLLQIVILVFIFIVDTHFLFKKKSFLTLRFGSRRVKVGTV